MTIKLVYMIHPFFLYKKKTYQGGRWHYHFKLDTVDRTIKMKRSTAKNVVGNAVLIKSYIHVAKSFFFLIQYQWSWHLGIVMDIFPHFIKAPNITSSWKTFVATMPHIQDDIFGDREAFLVWVPFEI